MSVLNAAMSEVHVTVRGSAVVPMASDLLKTLEDPVIEREIGSEAVRISLAQRLGGFDEMRVSSQGAPPQYVADVDFDGLCRCILNLQQEYDRVITAAQTAKSVSSALVASLKKQHHLHQATDDSGPTEEAAIDLAEQLEALLDVVTHEPAAVAVGSSADAMPDLERPAHHDAQFNGDSSDDDDERRSDDNDQRGYQRLLDDDDNDEENNRDEHQHANSNGGDVFDDEEQ